jgi:uncharacterized RDD family membrane protein YckC
MQCPKCGLLNPPTAGRCDCGYDFETRTVKASYVRDTTAEALPLADLGQRFAGQLIDGLIAYGPLILAVGGGEQAFAKAISSPALLFVVVYILFADGLKKGQSLGKRAMGTAVVDATYGTPCTFWKSFVRNICMFLGIFDAVFIFGKKRQRLGDRAANTIVIKLYPNELG